MWTSKVFFDIQFLIFAKCPESESDNFFILLIHPGNIFKNRYLWKPPIFISYDLIIRLYLINLTAVLISYIQFTGNCLSDFFFQITETLPETIRNIQTAFFSPNCHILYKAVLPDHPYIENKYFVPVIPQKQFFRFLLPL